MGELTVEAKALRGAPFFAGLSPEDIGGILQVGRPVSFEPRQAMVEQGDAGDGMYIVVSGTAEVDVGGRFHKLTTGDFFGEMALFTAGKRMATVKAVEPVRALKISADGFQSFLLEHPAVTLSMLQAVVERLREVEQRIDAWMAS
ncbi:MAG: Crp/Fnr family transcriptional regulator [Actinomycetota bacterium]